MESLRGGMLLSFLARLGEESTQAYHTPSISVTVILVCAAKPWPIRAGIMFAPSLNQFMVLGEVLYAAGSLCCDGHFRPSAGAQCPDGAGADPTRRFAGR